MKSILTPVIAFLLFIVVSGGESSATLEPDPVFIAYEDSIDMVLNKIQVIKLKQDSNFTEHIANKAQIEDLIGTYNENFPLVIKVLNQLQLNEEEIIKIPEEVTTTLEQREALERIPIQRMINIDGTHFEILKQPIDLDEVKREKSELELLMQSLTETKKVFDSLNRESSSIDRLIQKMDRKKKKEKHVEEIEFFRQLYTNRDMYQGGGFRKFLVRRKNVVNSDTKKETRELKRLAILIRNVKKRERKKRT